MAAPATDLVEEEYANRFAAALLMPRAAVEHFVGLGLTAPELARRFDVDEESMRHRLANLGLAAAAD